VALLLCDSVALLLCSSVALLLCCSIRYSATFYAMGIWIEGFEGGWCSKKKIKIKKNKPGDKKED
jgi:hypothetical protein